MGFGVYAPRYKRVADFYYNSWTLFYTVEIKLLSHISSCADPAQQRQPINIQEEQQLKMNSIAWKYLKYDYKWAMVPTECSFDILLLNLDQSKTSCSACTIIFQCLFLVAFLAMGWDNITL
jgi:hypothetical protein